MGDSSSCFIIFLLQKFFLGGIKSTNNIFHFLLVIYKYIICNILFSSQGDCYSACRKQVRIFLCCIKGKGLHQHFVLVSKSFRGYCFGFKTFLRIFFWFQGEKFVGCFVMILKFPILGQLVLTTCCPLDALVRENDCTTNHLCVPNVNRYIGLVDILKWVSSGTQELARVSLLIYLYSSG